PPSKTAKRLEDIYNFKQEGDESLYQAWEYCSNDGLAVLVNKLDNLGRDMKKIKESVHGIQVRCQICEGPLLDKDCPLNEEVKQVEETDNHPLYGKKRQSLEELLAKHQEESAQRSTEMEIEQLTKEIHSDKTLNSSYEQIKTVTDDLEISGLNKLHGVSFISEPKSDTLEVLQHQLPLKELNPKSFTLPCMIGKFNFYAMADLDMSKKAPLGIVENILVKIDKFLFPSDFLIIDNTPSETTILGRPFLATIHAEIDVFVGKISLGINEDRISFGTMRKDHNYTNPNNSAIVNNPTHRSFDDYKWEFNLEIDKLSDEYELGIGKKGTHS
ncbi:reverse transcriptase domain-containing protein, partial [Tanacetum coccineum]